MGRRSLFTALGVLLRCGVPGGCSLYFSVSGQVAHERQLWGAWAKGLILLAARRLASALALNLSLAPQMLGVSSTGGGVAVYGDLLTAVGDAIRPVLDEGFGARHGGIFEGRRYGCAGKRCRFAKDAERLMFEAGGMENGMQRDMSVRENAIVW